MTTAKISWACGVLAALGANAALAQVPKELPPSAPVAAGVRWAPSQGGAIPGGAEPTGYERGGFLYTCRASAQGGMNPGKVRPGFDGCFVPLGGREVVVPQYEVLLGSGTRWVFARDGQIPDGAVEVGRTQSGQPLYACRSAAPAETSAALMPGKTGAGLRGCNVGSGGREMTQPFYEVLVQ